MLIPIRFKYTFKNYPYAPKATRQSILLGVLNSWAVLAVIAFLCFGIIGYVIGDAIGNNAVGYAIGAATAILAIVLIKIYSKKKSVKIDELAQKETEANISNPTFLDDRKRKSDRASAILSTTFGIVLVLIAGLILPYSSTPVNSISGSEITDGGVYLLDGLDVREAYIKEEDKYGVTLYRCAIFVDGNNEKNIVSFSAAENSEKFEGPAGYYKASSFSNDFIKSSYSADSSRILREEDAHALDFNFRYVCSPDENITLHSLFGIAGVPLIIGLIFLGIGIVSLKKQKNK